MDSLKVLACKQVLAQMNYQELTDVKEIVEKHLNRKRQLAREELSGEILKMTGKRYEVLDVCIAELDMVELEFLPLPVSEHRITDSNHVLFEYFVSVQRNCIIIKDEEKVVEIWNDFVITKKFNHFYITLIFEYAGSVHKTVIDDKYQGDYLDFCVKFIHRAIPVTLEEEIFNYKTKKLCDQYTNILESDTDYKA